MLNVFADNLHFVSPTFRDLFVYEYYNPLQYISNPNRFVKEMHVDCQQPSSRHLVTRQHDTIMGRCFI